MHLLVSVHFVRNDSNDMSLAVIGSSFGWICPFGKIRVTECRRCNGHTINAAIIGHLTVGGFDNHKLVVAHRRRGNLNQDDPQIDVDDHRVALPMVTGTS